MTPARDSIVSEVMGACSSKRVETQSSFIVVMAWVSVMFVGKFMMLSGGTKSLAWANSCNKSRATKSTISSSSRVELSVRDKCRYAD